MELEKSTEQVQAGREGDRGERVSAGGRREK
jgi:hypothetical protein